MSMEKAKKVREKRELQKELGEWVFGFLALELSGSCATHLGFLRFLVLGFLVCAMPHVYL